MPIQKFAWLTALETAGMMKFLAQMSSLTSVRLLLPMQICKAEY